MPELDPNVDAALADLMEGLHERDEEQVYNAAERFEKMESGLGYTVTRYAGKFAESYWDNTLE